MAVAHGATVSASSSSAPSSLSVSVTVGAGSDRFLVASIGAIHFGSGSVSSVAWNGSSLTSIINQSDASNGRAAAFGLIAPAVATANLSASFSGADAAAIAGTSYTGVDQTTPTSGAVGASAADTVSITSEADAIVHGLVVAGGENSNATTGAGGSQTERVAIDGLGGYASVHVATKPGAAGSVVLDWTVSNGPWTRAVAGFSIKPSAGAAPKPRFSAIIF